MKALKNQKKNKKINLNKKTKKTITIGFITLAVIVFAVLCLLVYKSLFSNSESNRLENISKYSISSKEKKNVLKELKKIENVDDIEIFVNYKILKVMINLKEEIDFKTVKDIINDAVDEFDEDNLKYYDVEIFVECDEDSDIYPLIGYRHKSSEEIIW